MMVEFPNNHTSPVKESKMSDTTAVETTATPAKKKQPTWLIASALGLLVALIVGIFASMFMWPFKASDPGNIAFGITGPSEQVAQVETQLDAAQKGLLDVTAYDSRDEIVEAIEKRDVHGGLVISDTGMEMLTSSADNAQISQLLTQMATGMKEQQAAAAQQAIADAVAQAKEHGAPAEQILAIQEQAQEQAAAVTVTTTDVVAGGTNAAAGNLVILPALIGGMMTAMLSIFLVKRPWFRIISLVSGALFAGLSGALVLGAWMDLIPGDFGMIWLALSAGVCAVGATIMGLATLLGNAGIGLGVILMMLIGNPWGGTFVPTEFLGGFMGWLGAHMPNGNVIQLVRNIGYFPDASQSSQWGVFAAWIGIGLVLWLAGSLIHTAKAKKQAAVTA